MTLLDMAIAEAEGLRTTGVVVPGELHDLDEKRHAVAVDFPFDTIDKFRTDWRPGVWDESFADGWLPPMVWNHNADELIGSTIRSERLKGAQRMIGRYSDFDAVPRAKQAYQQEKDGEIPGYSFHYQAAESEPHRSVRGARSFVKAHMAEWGPTALPSIPGAVAVGIRSREATALSTITIETLRAMLADGDIDYQGYRALVGEHFPTLAPHLLNTRAATLQSIPHGSGESMYHAPANPSDGHGRDSNQHSEELASRPPGAPTLDQILMLHEAGHIGDDGKMALIKQHYPHLADHFRSLPPKSEDDIRALLIKTYGPEVGMRVAIAMPKAGNGVLGGSHDDMGESNGDNDVAKEYIEAINAALDEAEKLSEAGEEPEKRSAKDWSEVRAFVQVAHTAAAELADIMHVEVGDRSAKVSDEKWDGSASRFTPEQYHRSCLVSSGSGSTKDGCHLPVREPDGTINRNGVHAAAEALAGARGGVSISGDEKRSAARKLVGLYGQIGDKPPASLLRIAGAGDGDGDENDRSGVALSEVDDAFARIDEKRRRAG